MQVHESLRHRRSPASPGCRRAATCRACGRTRGRRRRRAPAPARIAERPVGAGPTKRARSPTSARSRRCGRHGQRARTTTGAGAIASQTTSTVSSARLAAHDPSLRDRSDARTIHGLARSSTITGKPAALAFEQLEWLALGRCGEAFDGCVAAHALSRLPGRIEQSRRGHRRTSVYEHMFDSTSYREALTRQSEAFLGGCLYSFDGHETRDIARDRGADTSDIDREWSAERSTVEQR